MTNIKQSLNKQYLETKDIAIIPIGSIEQHGPMAPLGTDIFTAEEIAKRLGKKKKNGLLPPMK